MRIEAPAIVLSLRAHGETGAIVRLMTEEHGLQAGYVRGARGRRMRPVLIAGNLVSAVLSARTDNQLPQATVELTHSRAPLLAEPLPAAAIEWAAALTATALVRYELLLLAELGFGLDLESCAVNGSTDDLIAVSPRSGRAVSAAEAEPYSGKLLRLPRFVREGGQANWPDIVQGLDLTGHFLMRDVLTQKSAVLGEARARLVERLRRAGGLD